MGERLMSYHVAPTASGPREIWGHRFSNLRDAMERAEELARLDGKAYTVWEMKSLWTAEVPENVNTVAQFRKVGAL